MESLNIIIKEELAEPDVIATANHRKTIKIKCKSNTDQELNSGPEISPNHDSISFHFNTLWDPLSSNHNTICDPQSSNHNTICDPLSSNHNKICEPQSPNHNTICDPISSNQNSSSDVFNIISDPIVKTTSIKIEKIDHELPPVLLVEPLMLAKDIKMEDDRLLGDKLLNQPPILTAKNIKTKNKKRGVKFKSMKVGPESLGEQSVLPDIIKIEDKGSTENELMDKSSISNKNNKTVINEHQAKFKYLKVSTEPLDELPILPENIKTEDNRSPEHELKDKLSMSKNIKTINNVRQAKFKYMKITDDPLDELSVLPEDIKTEDNKMRVKCEPMDVKQSLTVICDEKVTIYPDVNSATLHEEYQGFSFDPSDKKYSCGACDFRTKEFNYIKIHVRIHTGQKPFMCKVCDYRTNFKSSLKRHVLNNHSDYKLFSCDKCDYKTNYKNLLTSHIICHLNESAETRIQNYFCEKCKYETHDLQYLKKHYWRQHPDKTKYECNECDYKTNIKRDYEKHIHKHSTFSHKEIYCDECDYITNEKLTLKQHKLTHLN